MNNTCIIYDSNEVYARKLLSGFSERAESSFGVLLFTDREELKKYLLDNNPAVMVISQNGYFKDLEKLFKGQLYILTENSFVAEDSCIYGENTVEIFRYQSIDKIFKKVIENSKLQARGKLNFREIIGIYSPVYVEQRTAFALNIAKVISEKYKVLYINLEEFSGLDEILISENGTTLSDAFYYYRQGKQQSYEKISSTIHCCEGIDYITPVICAEDISFMEIEDIVGFIECVGKGGGYEIIVLDISTAIRQSWRLMECCTVVYMPIKNDYLSCRKISTLESYYYSMGVDSIIKVIEKVRLPEGENAVDKDFISKITTSGMYRYVKKLLESVLSINNANVK